MHLLVLYSLSLPTASHAGACPHNNQCSETQSERNGFPRLWMTIARVFICRHQTHRAIARLCKCVCSRATNSNPCQHKRSAAYKAISTAVLSPLYKPIISFLLVPKQAYVSRKNKKEQITSNLNPILFSGDSFLAREDKRGATGRDFIMCLSISEHKRSSKAEWNEEPWAYVFKSQLSQAL